MGNKKEVWKQIAFKGKKPTVRYAVSNHGRFGVMDKKGNVEVRTFKPQDGGFRFNYKLDGKSKALFIYREVAKFFVNKPSAKHTMIIRKDHNYLNDHPDNLKWATPEEHKYHVTNSPAALLARKKRPITVSHTARIFDEKSIIAVKKLIWDPKRKLTFKQIAEKYNVSEMQIYRIKSGELWFHVKVDNEPEHKRYTKNLENIAYQEKKAAKEKKKVDKVKKKETKKKDKKSGKSHKKKKSSKK